MQTLQPSIKSGRNVWNQEALPQEEFQSRVQQLQAAMTAKGLDLAFVYGRAFNGKADQAYLSNFVVRLAGASAVAVPREGAPALFFEGAARGLPSLKQTTWVDDVRAGSTVGDLCSKYLEGTQAKSVGLVGVRPQRPFQQFRALREALKGRQVSDNDRLVSDLRRVKSERELGRMRKAGSAVAAMFAAIRGPKVKLTERAVEAEGRLAARLQGAEDVRLLLMRPGDWALRLAGDVPIKKGERILVYASAEMDRYWAEAGRTFVAKEDGLVAVDAGTAGAIYQSMVKAVEQFSGGQQHDDVTLVIARSLA